MLMGQAVSSPGPHGLRLTFPGAFLPILMLSGFSLLGTGSLTPAFSRALETKELLRSSSS